MRLLRAQSHNSHDFMGYFALRAAQFPNSDASHTSSQDHRHVVPGPDQLQAAVPEH